MQRVIVKVGILNATTIDDFNEKLAAMQEKALKEGQVMEVFDFYIDQEPLISKRFDCKYIIYWNDENTANVIEQKDPYFGNRDAPGARLENKLDVISRRLSIQEQALNELIKIMQPKPEPEEPDFEIE